MDFLFQPKVLPKLCSLLVKVKDDKILGNESLELVIK